jgi:predicted DNA-binding transcriptional regulator AlpA
MTDVYLSFREVAFKLRLSETTLRKIVKTDSTFPQPYGIGKSRRWSESQIDEWVKAKQ